MAEPDDAIKALREALKLSPDNLPLRLHLAKSLSNTGFFRRSGEGVPSCAFRKRPTTSMSSLD